MDFQVIKACRIYFHAILAQPVEVRGVQSLASSVKRPSDACLLAFLHRFINAIPKFKFESEIQRRTNLQASYYS